MILAWSQPAAVARAHVPPGPAEAGLEPVLAEEPELERAEALAVVLAARAGAVQAVGALVQADVAAAAVVAFGS